AKKGGRGNAGEAADLPAARRGRPAGLRVFEERDRRKDAIYSYERQPLELDNDLRARLAADAAAAARWEAETPSFRRTAAHWLASAKRPETRERRFGELVEALRA